jgi:hypothetical protein
MVLVLRDLSLLFILKKKENKLSAMIVNWEITFAGRYLCGGKVILNSQSFFDFQHHGQ